MASSTDIPWSRVKALSFDIYGTLVDWENGIANAARATVLGPYLPSSHQKLMTAIEKHDTAVQREQPTLPQPKVIAEGLRRYANELGVVSSGKLTQEQIDQACEDYGAQIGGYPAFEDTVAAVQRLGKRFRLVPLTNVDNKSFVKTCEGPLNGISFDAAFTAEDIGSYKPDHRNFRYLLEHLKADLGVDKDDLVHVAQSLFHDHTPAREFGLTSVWVDRKGIMGNPGHRNQSEAQNSARFGYRLRVESLKELADIVDAAFN